MEYWIWMREIKGLGPILEKRLLNHFKTPKSIYEASERELLNKKSIKLLLYNDPLYPNIAKEHPESPTLLYYRGTIKEDLEGVGIVGSRRCSRYGKQVTVEAAEFLAKNNIPVISGMAKGIDGYAHTACLNSGGYTIAFLGTGVDICYPIEHIGLMEAIIANGAVISEYPLGTKARPKHFPKRNALISSWSKKLLVAEAAEKSGALITAEFSKKLKRKVLVPPHEIYSITGKGSNALISQGASIYFNASQVILNDNITPIKARNQIKTANIETNKKDKNTIDNIDNLPPIEKSILSCITNQPKTIEQISIELNIDQANLIENISIMELEGKIEDISGGRYRSCR